MQKNGDLVEYAHSRAVWATGTPGSGRRATMRRDGNLVVYTAGGKALWQSGTGGNAGGFVLDLQNNGNLVIYGVNGLGALWNSGSGQTGSGSGGYPYANAVCEWGGTQQTNPHCVNPADPGNENDWYDWGYWHSGTFRPFDQWGYEYRNCTSYVVTSGIRCKWLARFPVA